ncbi:putative mitochondrial hypothetical protein [Leptomonas pyrrhocoris]|uniref:Uncharacterized protein n=1 Tax=Leptomonas pyrrhocoris TaxID=157538 RepID=A0A0M9FPT2_LEPPY|nr:putative mitochondrial hypothetical protein [Leptomonas pyrrhocoris]KPA73605.1 putative mitochondrial hypothetical protein [Leptomonas pyrrhocoris]|eukprot:XP_015652044.1 putative mitochondrial hypothetical protein [Leptomonas pyrrhocoris]
MYAPAPLLRVAASSWRSRRHFFRVLTPTLLPLTTASCGERTRESRRLSATTAALTSSSSSVSEAAALCCCTRLLSTSSSSYKPQSLPRQSAGARRPLMKASAPRAARTHSSHREHTPTTNFAQRDLLQDAQQPQDQHHNGIFQSQHIKPFPVRAAIDIGTGGAISLCIGRVDARVGAVQKLLHQTQLPLYLEKLQQGSSEHASGFTLSERTVDDIRSKMRVLHGVMRRNAFEGLSERAAVLSWPLCLAMNAKSVADALTREFKVDVRVLGDTFEVQWPPSVVESSVRNTHDASAPRATTTTMTSSLSPAQATTSANARGNAASTTADTSSSAPDHGEDKLKALLRNTSASSSSVKEASRTAPPSTTSLRAQVDTLAFLAHAAVAQCVAPQRLLVLHEDPQRGVRLVGLGTSRAAEVADLLESAESAEAVAKIQSIAFGDGNETLTEADRLPFRQPRRGAHQPEERCAASRSVVPLRDRRDGLCLVEHTLPVDVAAAHRLCITAIQRRPPESYGLHTSSPNPLLLDEFCALRGLLTEMLCHELPRWAVRKSQLGGMLVATSHNGGLFNLAARVSQQTHISRHHLEVHAQYHFCGLTDVLLAENFPNPLLVLPSAALSAAILRALESPRMLYVPEVTVAAALLVQPSLWLASRAAEVRRRLSKDPFYAAHTRAQRGRVFARPHRKDNPTAAPHATWETSKARWNALSYEQSMKGT